MKSFLKWVAASVVVGTACGVPVGLALAKITNLSAWVVAITIVGWFATATAGLVLLSRVRHRRLRVILQSAFVGFAFAPSLLVGHGVAPAPAWLVMVLPGGFLLAIVPMILTAFIASPVFIIASLRRVQ